MKLSRMENGIVVTEPRNAGNQLLRLIRRKTLWVPLCVLGILAAGLWLVNYRLMKTEAIVFEIGQSIRGRLDDFTKDYKRGDPQGIASYYAEGFRGSELGFDKRQKISEEGGIVLEDWKAPEGGILNRQQMLDQLTDY